MREGYIFRRISRGADEKFTCREIEFVKALRILEYYGKRKSLSIIERVERRYYLYKYNKLSKDNCLSIPLCVCGKGLMISHLQNIIISSKAHIGENCRLFHNVTIGIKLGHCDNTKDPLFYGGGCPIIGDGVTICSGAGIFGDIVIGDDITIGANAVVTKSFVEGNIVLAGVPARIIGKNSDWSMRKFVDRVINEQPVSGISK